MTEIRFVLAPGQNQFFFELADALRFELEELGLPTSLSTEGFGDPAADRVFALIPPHEYFVLEGFANPPPPALLRRTIFISAEQPRTTHFRQNVALAPRGGALFDINSRAVRAYRRLGLRAEHLRLGYTRSWDRFESARAAERSTDVLFLGAHTDRRARIIAACEPALSPVRNRLVFSDNSRPNPAGSSSFLAGDDKWQVLQQTRWLLNVHQGEEPYFEWHRVLQAVHCGAAVITEKSTDCAPLEPGVHFAEAAAGDLSAELRRCLADETQRARMAQDAYTLIREEVPLRRGAERLAEAAERLRATPAGRPSLRAALAARAAAARVRLTARRASRRGQKAAAPEQADWPLRGSLVEPGGAGTPPAFALGPDGNEIRALLGDLPEEVVAVLLLGTGQTVPPEGLRRLEQGLSDDDVAYSYGLVAAREEIGNPFGWSPERAVEPPILIRTEALRRALTEQGEGTAGLAESLRRAGEGRNVQAFVARAPIS